MPLHPALAKELRGAAQAVGLRLAGIDVATPSLDEPLRESGGAVIEVKREPRFAVPLPGAGS